MRHSPIRNRFSFKAPKRRQLYAWLILAASPFLAALFGWIAGAVCLALALILKAPRAPHNDDLSEELGQGLDGLDSSRY